VDGQGLETFAVPFIRLAFAFNSFQKCLDLFSEPGRLIT
jgi:hypothetical protein